MSTDWKKVWDKKGLLKTEDFVLLSGFEEQLKAGQASQEFLSSSANKISEFLKLKKSDNLLEVGCGCGAIAQFLDCNYYGIDFSETSIKTHKKLFPSHTVEVSEANKLPFEDKRFDKCLINSVCHYFPSRGYFEQCVEELVRVTNGSILICDLPISSHGKDHLLFDKQFFEKENWEIHNGLYERQDDTERFCIIMNQQE
jgi:ubiquinone/menaquinone biosynthesis C-methylase UbiE